MNLLKIGHLATKTEEMKLLGTKVRIMGPKMDNLEVSCCNPCNTVFKHIGNEESNTKTVAPYTLLTFNDEYQLVMRGVELMIKG